jgi:hemin uptake protein HemP
MNDRQHRQQTPPPCQQGDALARDRDGCIDSRCLLAGGQCWICHEGQRYQLRITAANKLILTK